jgi:rubrerythrin
MPHFADPFSVLKADRKLTHEELIRAIRLMIAAEYEAVQLYKQLAESLEDNEEGRKATEVLDDIAKEEVVHAGEFLRLLRELEPSEWPNYKEGFEEVEEMLQLKKAE